MNTINRIILGVILCLCLCWTACKDDSVTPNVGQQLTGRIEDWQPNYPNVLHVGVANSNRYLILDSTSVQSDGSFSIRLPFPDPVDSMLRSFTAHSDSNQYYAQFDSRIFSAPATRFTKLDPRVYTRQGLAMSLYNANRFLLSDTVGAGGDYKCEFYYSSQPTRVIGTYSFVCYDSSLIRQYHCSKFSTIYDLSLSRGWNRIATVIVSVNSNETVYRATSDPYPETRWFSVWFESWNFSLAGKL